MHVSVKNNSVEDSFISCLFDKVFVYLKSVPGISVYFGHIYRFFLHVLTAVHCDDIGSIPNGDFTYSSVDRNYGTILTITCDEGHEVIGADRIVCRSDGSWSDAIPECKGIYWLSNINQYTLILYIN